MASVIQGSRRKAKQVEKKVTQVGKVCEKKALNAAAKRTTATLSRPRHDEGNGENKSNESNDSEIDDQEHLPVLGRGVLSQQSSI